MSDAFTYPEPELSDAVGDLEKEIFDEGLHGTPPKDGEPAADAKEPVQQVADEGQQQQQEGQPRDEQGRFKAAEQKAAPTEQQQQDAQQGGQQQAERQQEDGDNVPRWRVREIAEERRQAKAEADQLRVELARLQVAMQGRQRQEQQAQTAEIDPLLDPKGFVGAMRAEFQQAIATERLNSNLAIAHMRHGKVFEQAYEALHEQGQRGNGQLIRQLTAQPNPGEAIVGWWRNQEMLRETGGDLGAYKDKMRQELMKDPEFRKSVIEAIRAEANGGGQQQNGQGQGIRNITQLPPSLARASGSSANANDPLDTDDSDAAVFAHAWRR